MAKELTPRQKEIRALLDQDKTPAEIGVKLKISTNAVYQQLRRMHGGKGRSKTAQKRRVTKATTPAPSISLRPPAPAAPAPKPVTELRDMTPLQAIRARRTAIEGELRESAKTAGAAAKAAAEAADAAAKLIDKRKEELNQLIKAEAALTGKPVAAKRKATPAKPKTDAATNAEGNGSGDRSHLASVPPAAETPPPAAVPSEPPAATQPPAETPAPADAPA